MKKNFILLGILFLSALLVQFCVWSTDTVAQTTVAKGKPILSTEATDIHPSSSVSEGKKAIPPKRVLASKNDTQQKETEEVTEEVIEKNNQEINEEIIETKTDSGDSSDGEFVSTLKVKDLLKAETISATQNPLQSGQNIRNPIGSHHENHNIQHKPHGAELLGVKPGVTNLEDLENNQLWKSPTNKEVVDGYLIFTYQIEDLPDMPYIQILLREGLVEGIVAHLKEPRELKDTKLAFEDNIRNIRPILLPDNEGGFREIYPEKGLAFVLEAGEDPMVPTTRVKQIVAEAVRASYLVIRAEQMYKSAPEEAYKDLAHALQHDPDNGSANWLLARLELDRGEFRSAREHALKAVKSDGTIPQYNLTLVNVLKELGEIDNASKVLKLTLPMCQNYPLFLFEATMLQGDLARESSTHDCNLAIEYHQKALDGIRPYFQSEEGEIRILMKQYGIKAYIAIALDYAEMNKDNLQEKDNVFHSLNSASSLADNLIKKEGTDQIPLWEVCLAAAKVGVNTPSLKELNPYFLTLKRLSNGFIKGKEKATLPLYAIRWRSGQAFINAMNVYEKLQNYHQAIQVGEKAVECFEPFLKQSKDGYFQVYAGDFMYRIGNLYYNEIDNKMDAYKWFDKTFTAYTSVSSVLNPDESMRIGMCLIKMGNRYWNDNKKERAPEITLQAIPMLQRAYDEGLIEGPDLAVPFTNLAMMYKNLGKIELAKKYAVNASELQ